MVSGMFAVLCDPKQLATFDEQYVKLTRGQCIKKV